MIIGTGYCVIFHDGRRYFFTRIANTYSWWKVELYEEEGPYDPKKDRENMQALVDIYNHNGGFAGLPFEEFMKDALKQ
jgi:hypothetical protein